MTQLEQVIRQYVQLPSSPSAKGWYSVVCKACNDYKVRGAFLLNPDAVVYKCFNCSAKMNYFADSGHISDETQDILRAFDVPEKAINELILSELSHKSTSKRKKVVPTSIIKPIDVPDHFYKLEDAASDNIWAQAMREYLWIERGLTQDAYPFMLSDNKNWKGRLIIPYYFQNELIYYQGRDITDSKPNKYKNATCKDTTLLLFGYDNVAKYEETPLFVLEGFFDALQLDGVAILGNELTAEKISYINRTRREKIYIPDRHKTGVAPAMNALRAGWKISIPDTPGCKDIGEAIKKYGSLYVMRSLTDNTVGGVEALAHINLYCN